MTRDQAIRMARRNRQRRYQRPEPRCDRCHGVLSERVHLVGDTFGVVAMDMWDAAGFDLDATIAGSAVWSVCYHPARAPLVQAAPASVRFRLRVAVRKALIAARSV